MTEKLKRLVELWGGVVITREPTALTGKVSWRLESGMPHPRPTPMTTGRFMLRDWDFETALYRGIEMAEAYNREHLSDG